MVGVCRVGRSRETLLSKFSMFDLDIRYYIVYVLIWCNVNSVIVNLKMIIILKFMLLKNMVIK